VGWTDPTGGPAVTGNVAPASLWNTYARDNIKILGRDIAPFRHVGTTDMEIWYACGQGEATNVSLTDSSAFTTNTLFAVPFIAPRNSTIDRIAFEQISTGAGNARCGIYKTISDTNMYPGALVVDGGQYDLNVSAGVKATTISTALPDCYYWAVLINSSGAVTFRRLLSTMPLIGFPSTLGSTPQMTASRTQTYGALPSTFPASPFTSLTVGPAPLIGVRFSG